MCSLPQLQRAAIASSGMAFVPIVMLAGDFIKRSAACKVANDILSMPFQA